MSRLSANFLFFSFTRSTIKLLENHLCYYYLIIWDDRQEEKTLYTFSIIFKNKEKREKIESIVLKKKDYIKKGRGWTARVSFGVDRAGVRGRAVEGVRGGSMDFSVLERLNIIEWFLWAALRGVTEGVRDARRGDRR